MIRVTNALGRVRLSTFCSIQQHKPTPIQERVQQEGIMAKKMLDHKYKLIKSSPLDSKQTVNNNFMALKTKLNSRHYYIPNKNQYLEMLDQAYEDIIKVHEDHGIMEYSKQKGKVTKKQFITYQLKRIKKAKIIAMLQSYQFSSILLLICIIIEIVYEEFIEPQSGKFQITNQYGFTTAITKLLKKGQKQYLLFIHSNIPESKFTTTLQKKLEQLGVEFVKKDKLKK